MIKRGGARDELLHQELEMIHSAVPPRPQLTEDYTFFLEGLQRRELLVQKCDDCGALRPLPGPMCPDCHSFAWSAQALRGGGSIYSYIVHYHPPIPPFATPHIVALADMDEGVRVTAALDFCVPEDVTIGMRVGVAFAQGENGFLLHHFVPEART
jgi:uncharacterized OB-fold protein